MHHYPKFHQNPINKVLDLYVTHLTNRSVSHGGCLLICSLWFLWYFPMDCMPAFHYFVPLSSGLHCGGEKMTVFRRKNVRTLDWNVCLKCEGKKIAIENTAWLLRCELHCLKVFCLIKALSFSLFPWEQFALDREQRRCSGGGQRGRQCAGRQQVMCLPPECLHMLCVHGFMAVPPLARIPHRLGVKGHHGALYSWPAGPAQACHPPAETESYTHTCI